MKNFKILSLLAIVIWAFVGCTNDQEDILEEMNVPSSRAAVEYFISGPSELQTYAEYSIVSSTGDLNGITVTWDYPSDFYRISYTNTSITLGRKNSVGSYTLHATLSNGIRLSKQIEAVDDNQISNEDIANALFICPISIASHSYEDYVEIDAFNYNTGVGYDMKGSDELNIKCRIDNTTSTNVSANLNLFRIRYGNDADIYYPKYIDTDNTTSSNSIVIPGNSSKTVTLHLGYEWRYHIIPSVNIITFNFYYQDYPISSVGYGYRLIN